MPVDHSWVERRTISKSQTARQRTFWMTRTRRANAISGTLTRGSSVTCVRTGKSPTSVAPRTASSANFPRHPIRIALRARNVKQHTIGTMVIVSAARHKSIAPRAARSRIGCLEQACGARMGPRLTFVSAVLAQLRAPALRATKTTAQHAVSAINGLSAVVAMSGRPALSALPSTFWTGPATHVSHVVRATATRHRSCSVA